MASKRHLIGVLGLALIGLVLLLWGLSHLSVSVRYSPKERCSHEN